MKLATMIHRGARGAPALLCIVIAAPLGAQKDASRLALPGPPQIEGRVYALDMTQSIDIDAHNQRHNVERQIRIRFGFGDARPEAGERVGVSVGLDSMRAAMNTPHGRQVVDTRRSIGTTLDLVYSRRGGPPTYGGRIPELDFGVMGGALPVSALIDHVFPAMPERPVRVGESWERITVRRQLDGKLLTERRVTSRLTLARLERRNGVTLARVEVTTRGEATGATVSGPNAAGGNRPSDTGTIESTGYVLIGVADGVVHEVSLQESLSGSWDFNGSLLPFRQSTRIHVARSDDARPARRGQR